MVTTAALPDWLATTDETAAALAAWARERGLSYERHGAEPAAPFAVAEADGWLAVYERVDDSGRSITRLDALAAEAARVTQPRP